MPNVIGQRGGGRTIILPLASKIDSKVVRQQFAVSRSTMMRWRKLHGFPATDERGQLDASAIVAWAKRLRVNVEWV